MKAEDSDIYPKACGGFVHMGTMLHPIPFYCNVPSRSAFFRTSNTT